MINISPMFELRPMGRFGAVVGRGMRRTGMGLGRNIRQIGTHTTRVVRNLRGENYTPLQVPAGSLDAKTVSRLGANVMSSKLTSQDSKIPHEQASSILNQKQIKVRQQELSRDRLKPVTTTTNTNHRIATDIKEKGRNEFNPSMISN